MEISKVIEKLAGRKPEILGHNQLLKYAVLLPLIEVQNETHILFEVRSLSLRRQPGEICFPGGKVDPDDLDQKHCAIRETTEELGIKKEDIVDVIPLDYMLLSTHNMIYPFIGTITTPELIKPNLSEVGEVFTVPLSYFRKTKPRIHKINFQIVPEEGFPFDLIIGGENYQWQQRPIEEYFYQYDGKVIWGLTARILTNFLNLLDLEK